MFLLDKTSLRPQTFSMSIRPQAPAPTHATIHHDPLAAALRAIETNASAAAQSISSARSRASSPVLSAFLDAAAAAQTQCATIAKTAAEAVAQAERLVIPRDR